MTADETTVPQDDSKNPNIPAQRPSAPAQATSGEPEPVILEERVVKAAAPKPKSPVAPVIPEIPAPAAAPTPAPVPALVSATTPTGPYEAKEIPQLVVPNPDPNFKPTILSADSELQQFEKKTPEATPEPPKAAPAAEPPAASGFEKILESIKLPERRDFKASADVKKYPTTLVENADSSAAPANNAAPAEESASSIVTPLRTLKDDLQTIVKEQKISLVHAASLEEEKKHGQEHLAPEQVMIRSRRTRRTTLILFSSGMLILLGFGALFGVYYVAQQQAAIPAAPQESIMFAEQTAALSLDKQAPQNLKDELAQARTKQLGSLGSITRIVPTIEATSSSGQMQEVPASIQQFFAALGISPPQGLMSAIGPNFFFGFHVVDTNAPLFVIPVTSYDHAFAGMLAWETSIDQGLSPVFTTVPPTVEVNGVPQQRTFQDQVLRNYDVRELTDDQGNVVLYYSFPTPNILIIAQSPYSFTEILSRLQAAREL